MADRRHYTGTKTLQTGWTVAVLAVAVAASMLLGGAIGPAVTVGGVGVVWVAGLVVLGIVDRRHWTRMTEASAFDPGMEAHTSDLQKIIGGQSVSVTTDVPGLFSQAHLIVRANVEGVNASFTVRVEDRESANRGGLTTGDGTFDERYVVRGKEQNVAPLLTKQVREALLAVETPGAFTITADQVRYEVPFTRVTVAELDAAGTAVATVAARLEAVGRESE